jgi:hypothetical protein
MAIRPFSINNREFILPQIRESEVLLSGTIIDISDITDFKTGALKGKRYFVLGAEGGSNVRFKTEDVREEAALGSSLTAYVRFTAYDIEGKSGMSCNFVRFVSSTDLEVLKTKNN